MAINLETEKTGGSADAEGQPGNSALSPRQPVPPKHPSEGGSPTEAGCTPAAPTCPAEASERRRKSADGGSLSSLLSPLSALRWALLLLPFGYLWFRLINNLRLEWATNPQYSYGWVVPVLCAGLLVRRWEILKAESRKQKSTDQAPEVGGQLSRGQRSVVNGPAVSGQWSVVCGQWSVVLLFAALAFLYLPTRLIEAATPEWRPIQWSLGLIVIGLTLCAIYLGKGRGWVRQLAFPICFLAVAIPWPTLIEQPIIQGLTRWDASMVIEVMGLLGVPALQHGNVIEVGTGVVGIDEACSGIRSFQSSIMISLFLGEFYMLRRFRRVLLVLIGFLLAFVFNVCRTSLLTYVAAKKGVAAISDYHDPAGLAILLACTAGMFLVALLLKRQKAESREQSIEGAEQKAGAASPDQPPVSAFQRFSVSASPPRPPSPLLSPPSSLPGRRPISAFQLFSFSAFLLAWLVVVETGVYAWYRSREAHFVPSPSWSLVFPEDNPSFKALPIGESSRYLLRFDEGKQGEWQEADGTLWQAFYFNWFPGRVAGYLAKRHTPEICMPASGREMTSGPELMVVKVNGIELPIRHYVFGGPGNGLQVFHCRWEDGMEKAAYVQHEAARFNLVRGIWAGRGIHGQKVLEFIISGCEDSDQAKAALVRQLEKLIRVEADKTLTR